MSRQQGTPRLNIAIIGAGPAGLTLARLLHVSSSAAISVNVFEKDASPTARGVQVGGTLDLHHDTGLLALREAGLERDFERYARHDGEALVIADRHGTGVVRMGGGTKKAKGEGRAGEQKEKEGNAWSSRPEIDRERLKEILLASVEEQTEEVVKWGWKLKGVVASSEASLGKGTMLEFEGHEERQGPFDLVVGADGAWSKVRVLLTDVRPTYSGVCGFELRIPRPNDEYLAVSATVGRGSYFAFSNGKAILAQRMGDEGIKVGCWVAEKNANYPQDVLARGGVEGARKEILTRFRDWANELLDIVRCSNPEYLIPWTLYELPVGHRWEHKKGLTLIGDAASLMTPFAGEGVNKAMKDALELRDAICRSLVQKGGREAEKEKAAVDSDHDATIDSRLDAEVAKYEEGMFPRAAKVQAETMRNKETMFADDAPLGFLMAMVDVVVDEFGPVLGRILWLPVWILALVYFWTRLTFGQLVRWYW